MFNPFNTLVTLSSLPADVVNELRLLKHSIQIDAPGSLQEVNPNHGAQHIVPVARQGSGLRQQQMDHLHDSRHFTRRMFQMFHLFDLFVGDICQGMQLRILQLFFRWSTNGERVAKNIKIIHNIKYHHSTSVASFLLMSLISSKMLTTFEDTLETVECLRTKLKRFPRSSPPARRTAAKTCEGSSMAPLDHGDSTLLNL